MQGDQILLVLEKRGMHYNIKLDLAIFWNKYLLK